MLNEALLPHIDEVNAPFWEGCRTGKLRVQQCTQSGQLLFPPRPWNSWTPGAELRWHTLSGRGTIWSAVEPHPPLMLDFTELAPYNAIIVAAEEDPAIRFVGNLISAKGEPINSMAYDDIEIGAQVEVVFEKISDTITLPRWILSSH